VRGSDGLSLQSLLRIGTVHVKVGRVLAIVVAGAALQVVTQVLLARGLPKAEVGLVSLVLGALPLLSTLSLLGQDSAAVRFLSRSEPGRYAERSYIARIIAVVVPLGAAVGLAGAGLYGLSGIVAVALVVTVAAQNVLAVTTSVMRARHRYEIAMLGVWLPRILTALSLIALALFGRLTVTASLGVIVAAFAIAAVAYVLRHFGSPAEGSEPVPGGVFLEGFFLFGLSVSFSVMVSFDKLIIGKLMTYEDLAVYATIFAVMKGFDFLFYSVTYVLMPRVNAMESVSLHRLNASIAAAAVLLTGAYLAFGDDAVRLLYEGRYDRGAFLIVPFALSGVLKLFYSVPSSIIGGHFPRRALRQFLWVNLAGMALNIVLDIVLILAMGLLGAAVATAIAWALRLTGGYAIVMRHRSHLGPGGGDVGPI
jgi:O-antigen/teichoic acid export membrane protein